MSRGASRYLFNKITCSCIVKITYLHVFPKIQTKLAYWVCKTPSIITGCLIILKDVTNLEHDLIINKIIYGF